MINNARSSQNSEEEGNSGYLDINTLTVYCRDIPELNRRPEEKLMIETEYYRWGVDHEKEFFNGVCSQYIVWKIVIMSKDFAVS